MKPNKFWFVSELYYPDESATGTILTRIAEGLSGRYSVHAVCRSYRRNDGRKALREEVHNGVSIHRCWSMALDRDVLFSRIINVVSISVSIFFKVLFQVRRGDLLLVVTNPPVLPYLAVFATRLKGAASLVLIHDLFPDALDATKLSASDSLVSRLFDLLNRYLYRSVSRIVVLGRDMQLRVVRKKGVDAQRVVIIRNWADAESIVPTARRENGLLRELHLEDKFVVQYGGTMGYSHGVESIVECANRFRNDPDIHFLFIGSGVKKRSLEEAVRRYQLTNVTMLPHQSRDAQHITYNACDVGIIAMVRGMSGVAVPSRMYNIMSAGKPIIAVAEKDSELAMVVAEERIGWIVEPGDPEGLARVISVARTDQAFIAEAGRRARIAAEGKYTFQHVLRAYGELVDALEVPVAH